MDKLLHLGVPKTILHWLSAFLSNCIQYVQTGHAISVSVHINEVLPQGSLMDMEAFCVQIDDLKPPLPMYVDDKYVYDNTTFNTLIPQTPVIVATVYN